MHSCVKVLKNIIPLPDQQYEKPSLLQHRLQSGPTLNFFEVSCRTSRQCWQTVLAPEDEMQLKVCVAQVLL